MPLLSPAFRRSHFCRQMPSRPQRRERSEQSKVELWARMLSGNFAEMTTTTPFRDLLHAANLRHGTDGFTSPPKEDVLRIFAPLQIRRLRPGLNLRTWVLVKHIDQKIKEPSIKLLSVVIFNPLKTSDRPLYLTQSVNTFQLCYKNQSVYAVSCTSRCLSSDKYKTHEYSVGRTYSC